MYGHRHMFPLAKPVVIFQIQFLCRMLGEDVGEAREPVHQHGLSGIKTWMSNYSRRVFMEYNRLFMPWRQ